MPTPWHINVFGVRHLSPAGAWHLRRYLDRIKPDLVLIEGLADASELISQVTRKGSRPPIALLAYTDSLPVRTLIYPFAKYSPEFQAMCWADERDTAVEFIDLPSDVFLALQDIEQELREKFRKRHAPDGSPPPADSAATEEELPDVVATAATPEPRVSVYEEFARRSGEVDYETYWERNFEHNVDEESYRLAAFEFGRSLRELEQDAPRWRAENLVREAFMRRQIEAAIKRGVKPEKIVAVVGAYHAPVLTGDFPPMTDGEFASLRRRASKFTLMPYSYFKLSSQSGYGAGNQAPAYYELLWEALEANDLGGLPSRYLSLVARHSREAGTHRSTAEVIEGVRLANTLSAMKDGLAPTLADLRDAAVTLIGHGELAGLKDALARVDVGTAIGELPKGVSRTSIQADFERELVRLKLEKYKTTVKQELSLDLRENRQAKAPEAAFLDLSRSSFFHRLRVLGVGFVTPLRTSQASSTWAEKWVLQWSPESEIQLIEAVLLGETVELATGYKFTSILESCESIAKAAEVVNDACQCGLMKAMDAARKRLQELSAATSELTEVAHAAHLLGLVVRYGDVRKFDPEPLLPLVEELFVHGALALHAAAGCDNEMAPKMMVAIDEMNQVALEHADRVDEPLWVDRLRRLSDADDRNPLLSGYACAILLERGLIENEDLAREVSRRLSPGVPADLGAGWFEGLSKRNRYALLARQVLWAQLADYISALDEEHFRRSVVFLRRAFGGFSPREKRQIAENLAEHWGVSADAAATVIEADLTEKEEKTLKDLNEFNFDDL
ncbi:MAG TPA: DUF5682 family protein [Tepidisphaeraceae bacterium]|nr:DUF5682 family protein [Tepidisphaeraceae bacterium]